MKLLFELLLAMAIAVGSGLGSAWYIVGDGWLLKTDTFGVWGAWPMSGSSDADPYTRAVLARTGQVPLAQGEGTIFFAARDDTGAAIRGGCEYRVVGNTPPARLWTLTLIDANADLPRNPSGVTYVRSDRILRDETGQFVISISPKARPGNWLPLQQPGRFTLVLRLYDTPASFLADLHDGSLPRIEHGSCQ
ncbi:MAG: DUF1214 domain-containing protein [Ancalomicrobiaceae bacterium]|nr:DUF1214 domain-containing protein [Ancalomicrobiaceae bacterium]